MAFKIPVHDESHHPESPLEWWFVQGFFEGRSFPKHSFMASLFRHNIPQEGPSPRPTFSLLLSILDEKAGVHRAESWVDAALVESFLKVPPKIQRSGVYPILEGIYRKELRKNGPPRSFRASPSGPSLRSNPLTVEWESFSLVQGEDDFALTFEIPQTRHAFAFRLKPVRDRWSVEEDQPAEGPGRTMKYMTYSRLLLDGLAGGLPVRGEAWLDHQWGGYGWLVSDNGARRVRGWDWLGINLEDGTDWVVIVHRDAATKNITSQHLARCDPSGRVMMTQSFALRPSRVWESPRTAVRYPVEWRLTAPELEADLEFSPEADDQEIPVFGPPRAVWEGAGRVAGTVAGKKVKGRARCELYGYGYIFDFRDYMKALSERVDRHLEEFLPRNMTEKKMREYIGPPSWKYEASAHTTMLSDPAWDLVSRGGKRWRPTFGLLLLDALGREAAPFEKLICTLGELCHTGALIIDDIEDASLIRRGDACIHLRYGLDTAINAANTLYLLPWLLIFRHPLLSEKQRLAIHEVMTRQYVRAHFGQALDLFWSRHMSGENLRRWLSDSMAPKILQMYEFKTGAFVEGLAETAAIVAESPADLKRDCVRFASALGVAFQIMDDVRNFTAAPRQKKTLGEDLVEGKLTYVIFRALESLGPARQKEAPADHRFESDPPKALGHPGRSRDHPELGGSRALPEGSGAAGPSRLGAAGETHPAFGIEDPPSDAQPLPFGSGLRLVGRTGKWPPFLNEHIYIGSVIFLAAGLKPRRATP